jgi:hypothetical protein
MHSTNINNTNANNPRNLNNPNKPKISYLERFAQLNSNQSANTNNNSNSSNTLNNNLNGSNLSHNFNSASNPNTNPINSNPINPPQNNAPQPAKRKLFSNLSNLTKLSSNKDTFDRPNFDILGNSSTSTNTNNNTTNNSKNITSKKSNAPDDEGDSPLNFNLCSQATFTRHVSDFGTRFDLGDQPSPSIPQNLQTKQNPQTQL